ncbi:50S ribosomal protein L21 [Candidatus Microgenomates bacterium]|nr:50S ribosomal protein L21 [Candidatus Microgenomates bacterium]
MNFAIIRTAGKQFLVKEGDTIEITGDGKDIDVLLLSQDDKVKVGTPLVEKVTVKTEVVKNFSGEKIRVAKFKAKSRYRKVTGFRAKLTTLKITKIGESKAK